MRIRASFRSKRYSASIFAKCVLPTPVGPKKINDPIGRFGSFNPARVLRIAFVIVSTALSWPITTFLKWSSIWSSFSDSLLAILWTGIPVIIATTSAISSSFTFATFVSSFRSHLFRSKISSSCSWRSTSLNFAALSKSWCFAYCSFSNRIFSIRCSSSKISFGTTILEIWTREPVSSKTSIALSGKNLSVMYLSQSRMVDNNASSE